CGLAPAQELVTLAVAFVFDFNVTLDGVRGTEVVDLNRVVDDEFCGCQWVDQFWVTTKVYDGFTHGGQVNDTGNAGEVLHQNAGRSELNFGVWLSGRIPVGQGLDL